MKKLAVVPALLLFVQVVNAQAVAADSITGKVIYSGPKPTVRNISMEANAVCAKLHPNGLPSPEVILNPDNTLQNALVYVKSRPRRGGKAVPDAR